MENNEYKKGFIPYALAAFLIGLVGGFSTVLGPAFVQDIGISYNNTTWTALAQAAATAACAPVFGKLGDAIGHKITLLLGIVVFLAGNVLTTISNSLTFMIVARFVVGLGAAAMTPVIMAYIITQFPPDQVAKGFSLYMLISSVSVTFGPTLGGIVISAYGWRTMLWICVAICTVIFLACVLISGRPEIQRKSLQNFDGVGAALVLLFFGLMLCIPAFGQNFGWMSRKFICVLAAAGISFTGLVMVERKAVQPILSGKFMLQGPFALSIIALFLTQGLLQTNMTNTIVFVNYTLPEKTAISGYAISIMYVGMSLGAVILGPLADRVEPKRVLVGSLFLTGIGCAIQFLFSMNSSAFMLMASLGILGFGLGGNGTIFMKVALSGVPSEEAGAGTGAYGLFRDLAAPFGVAVFVPLFTNKITRFISGGMTQNNAAIQSIHQLAFIELICILCGIVVVSFLPKIHNKRGAQ